MLTEHNLEPDWALTEKITTLKKPHSFGEPFSKQVFTLLLLLASKSSGWIFLLPPDTDMIKVYLGSSVNKLSQSWFDSHREL